MTPGNSREITLNLGRERLARALAKIDRLSRDAIETITQLRADKSELEHRLSELHKRAELDRTNFEQRAILLQSINSETEERVKAFEALQLTAAEQEATIQDQLSAIAQLKADLGDRAVILNEQLEQERALRTESETLRATNSSLEERLTAVTYERDTMKSQLYAREREDAQWALKLNADDRTKATKAIDTLIDQLASIETRITSEQRVTADAH